MSQINVTNKFGIMQGRLTPKYQGHYQSHPAEHWQSEFFIAHDMGFSHIEFILDSWSLKRNPLLSDDGIKYIKKIAETSDVSVKSICADVFMDYTFVSDARTHDPKPAINILRQTIAAAVKLGARDIVIPCVDRSSIPSEHGQNDFVKVMAPLCQEAFDKGVRINIESDWAPKIFLTVLDEIGNGKVWVNYDSGNSAACGHDVKVELETYGNRISDFHIKDRILAGGSVPLGTGDTDFSQIISWIKETGFDSPLIFQAARAELFVDDLILLQSQLEWFTNLWRTHSK